MQKRQHGGIGSSAHDPLQTDIRAFFGGAAAAAEEPAKDEDGPHEVEVEEGRAVSNVFDEAKM